VIVQICVQHSLAHELGFQSAEVISVGADTHVTVLRAQRRELAAQAAVMPERLHPIGLLEDEQMRAELAPVPVLDSSRSCFSDCDALSDCRKSPAALSTGARKA